MTLIGSVDRSEFGSGKIVRRKIGDKEIILVLSNDEIKAYSGVCPHVKGPLLDGEIKNNAVVCPWHEYAFDLDTGACTTKVGEKWTNNPAIDSELWPLTLKPYRVELEGDTINIYR